MTGEKYPTNPVIAELLRKIAAAYLIGNENRFRIIAYEKAADSIEHLTGELKDIWDENKLADVPGIGPGIAGYLDELFRTGRVKHFDSVMAKVPEAVFPLLLVPGIGPKKAFKLVTTLKLKSAYSVIKDLEKAAKAHKIASIEGFGEKSEQDILAALGIYKRGQIKENRMSLALADEIAQDIIAYLKKDSPVEQIDVLGSLRRQVSTIGDIDIAVATYKPEAVIERFLTYPHQKVIERGPTGASLLLANGRQVDVRVQEPKAYGAMLQYFTGSKNHNIKLRTHGLSKGLSLNEYGIKLLRPISNIQFPISNYDKEKKVYTFSNEESFYKAIGLPWIPPELREDKGEIEAAIRQTQDKQPGLPKLIETTDIKGDLHIHAKLDYPSSHDIGTSTLPEYLDKASTLGYEYIGISDHNPSITNQSEKQIIEVMKRRKDYYESLAKRFDGEIRQTARDRRIKIFVMCEVDILPDGKLALPDGAFEYVDAVIVSLHSSFTQEKKQMTSRVIKALTYHPKVRIFGHPTGRLLTKREGVELEWAEIFTVCKKNDIALEINANPERLDLPDFISYEAVKNEIKLCIDTDSHAVDQMDLMRYGVSVARRAWATKRDIVDSMPYNEFRTWLLKGG